MCPVLLLSLICSFLLVVGEATVSSVTVVFTPSTLNFREGDKNQVNFTVTRTGEDKIEYQLVPDERYICDFDGNGSTFVMTGEKYDGSFNLKAIFLGRTKIRLIEAKTGTKEEGVMDIAVKRKASILSLIFTISVASLVSLNYINMGCVLDINVVKATFKRPIAPLIGFLSQYIVMPLVTYAVGYFFLYDAVNLRLGLFVFGCSPAGGASNMWTVLLKGNLDLSITMTFISTVASVAMLPLWTQTLGKTIFKDTATTVPITNVLSTLLSMVFFLGIGLAIQRYLPRVAAVSRRILAPVSIGMIIFIVIFGSYSNLYMFSLMDFRILACAGASVWIGFSAGYIISRVLRQNSKDIIAISIETGIQNTGIAIVLLGLSLPEPDNDIASVIPVASSIMTPIPLTIAYLIMRCTGPKNKDDLHNKDTHEEIGGDQKEPAINSTPNGEVTPAHGSFSGSSSSSALIHS